MEALRQTQAEVVRRIQAACDPPGGVKIRNGDGDPCLKDCTSWRRVEFETTALDARAAFLPSRLELIRDIAKNVADEITYKAPRGVQWTVLLDFNHEPPKHGCAGFVFIHWSIVPA